MQTSRNKLSTWISGIHGGQWGKNQFSPVNQTIWAYMTSFTPMHIFGYTKQPAIEVFQYMDISGRQCGGNRKAIVEEKINSNYALFIWYMYAYMQFKSMLLLIWVRSNRTMEYHIHHQKTMEVQRARKVHTIGSWAGCLTPENML